MKNCLIACALIFYCQSAFAGNPAPLYDKPVHLGEGGVEVVTTPLVQTPKSYSYSTHSKDRASQSLGASKKSKTKKHLWDYRTNHFNYYSIDQEIQIGEQYFTAQKRAFEKKNIPVNPPGYKKTLKRLQKIVERLGRVSDRPDLPYEVALFDKKDVSNAYCLPGGKMGVFTGIFDPQKGLVDINNDDEIAAVLAHEMAHANLRHVTRHMTTSNSVGMIGSFLSMGVARGAGGGWGYLSSTIFNTGTFLFMPGYSRRHEREADQVGLYYMVKAGFDPNAAIRVWERAAQMKKEKGKADKTSFFSSHPASGERAETLRSYLPDIDVVKERQQMYKKMRE